MQITGRQEFPAPPHATHAMLTDPAFLALSAQRLGAYEPVVRSTPDATSVRASVPAPVEVRAFVGERMDVVQECTWGPASADGSRAGSFRFTVAGAPVELSARTALAPGGRGTVVHYEGTLSVSVPLVGPMVERAAAPTVLESLASQERAGEEWLAR